MSKLLPLLVIILFLFSCREEVKQTPISPVNQDSTQKDVAVFPVTEYFQGQLNELDSMPITLLKIDITGSKTDSTWLPKKDIRNYVQPFLTPIIDSALITSYFKQRSFMDQTINAVTFTYDTPSSSLPDSINLKECDVYVDPDRNSVTRIYMLKSVPGDRRSLDSQLTWKTGKSFSIRTIVEEQGKPAVIKEQIIKWDFSDDDEEVTN